MKELIRNLPFARRLLKSVMLPNNLEVYVEIGQASGVAIFVYDGKRIYYPAGSVDEIRTNLAFAMRKY